MFFVYCDVLFNDNLFFVSSCNAFFSAGLFLHCKSFFRCQFFSDCLCFGVEVVESDGRDNIYIISIDPVGNTALNVGMAGCMWIVKKRKSHVRPFNGTSYPQRRIW